MFINIEEEKGTILDFWQGTVKALWTFSQCNFVPMYYQYKMTQYNTLKV